MSRPRKYIQIDGQTIDGVSRHRPSKRYYIIDRSGNRVYFNDWREASARLPRLFSLGYGVAEDEGVDERDYFARSLAIYCLDRGRLNVTDPQIEKWFRSVLWNESLWRRTLDSMGEENA